MISQLRERYDGEVTLRPVFDPVFRALFDELKWTSDERRVFIRRVLAGRESPLTLGISILRRDLPELRPRDLRNTVHCLFFRDHTTLHTR